MITGKINNIAKETVEILNYFDSSFVSKISVDFLSLLKELARKSSITVTIDKNKKLEEQAISEECKNLIALIYRDYIADEEEKRNMIFSELYTRAQSITRTLFACSMKCRVMDSNDLVQLLYVADNRDESETYGIDKALQAGYGELYSTAPDVLDKKMLAINKAVEEKAMELAKQKVEEIKSTKQKIVDKKEENFDKLVEDLATLIIKDNKNFIGKDVANEAIKSIKGEDTKEEEVKENVKKEKKPGRPRKNA